MLPPLLLLVLVELVLQLLLTLLQLLLQPKWLALRVQCHSGSVD